jgi:lipoprotein NlpI/transglutaminase-like putative cysteine protease
MSHFFTAGRGRALLALAFAGTVATILALVQANALAAEKSAKPQKPIATSTAYTVGVEPVPAWVVPAKENPNAAVTAAPLRYRVVDEQTRVEDKTSTMYLHVVRVVGDTTGLGPASQIEIEFDPSYQALAFHHVDIVRDGKRTTRLDRKRVQLLQRETQLERRMYDGRVTASMVLDDVRVGDQIDFAYSIRGQNPVFEGRHVSEVRMISLRGPAALYQFRLLAPESRRINVRVGSPDIIQSSTKVERGLRETIFRREGVPQFHVDADAPYAAVLREELQLSEFDDWAEVTSWGVRLFAPATDGGPAVAAKAAEIKASSADPEQQVLAALHFVQADVRYFGTEIGLNSHRPAMPDKVIAQRFGDCKDKVSLLIALLKKLDISAQPVLVSTFMRGRVDQSIASPLAFDHVIARVQVNGKVYDLDATREHQTGTLASRQSVGLGKGLLVAADTKTLTVLPGPFDREQMAVHDIFRIDRFPDGATLESRITYRGDLADAMRESLATGTLPEMQTQLSEPYARAYPKLVPTEPMTVLRSDTDDTVTFVLKFRIPDFWRFPDKRLLVGEMVQWSVIDALRFPNDPQRKDPFTIALPGIFRHVSTVEFAEDVFTTPNTQNVTDGDKHFRLRTTSAVTTRRSEYASELRMTADQVDAADWTAYITQVNKLGARAGASVSVPAMSAAALDKLRLDLREADEQIRANKVRPKTEKQAQALFQLKLRSAQLDAGRLQPNLKAEVLTARGIEYDNLGRYDEGARDFRQALELAPDSAEVLNAAAVNALETEDFVTVMTLTGRVLDRNPGDGEARHSRALAAYFKRDFAAATSELDELLKDQGQVRRGYPLLWLSLASRNGGIDVSRIDAAITEDQLPTEWPRALVDWSRGKLSADAVIASAKSSKESAERLCEAYFYIGEKYLADGDTARAKDYFQKSVDQGITEYLENGSSKRRLASLKH